MCGPAAVAPHVAAVRRSAAPGGGAAAPLAAPSPSLPAALPSILPLRQLPCRLLRWLLRDLLASCRAGCRTAPTGRRLFFHSQQGASCCPAQRPATRAHPVVAAPQPLRKKPSGGRSRWSPHAPAESQSDPFATTASLRVRQRRAARATGSLQTTVTISSKSTQTTHRVAAWLALPRTRQRLPLPSSRSQRSQGGGPPCARGSEGVRTPPSSPRSSA